MTNYVMVFIIGVLFSICIMIVAYEVSNSDDYSKCTKFDDYVYCVNKGHIKRFKEYPYIDEDS